MSKQNLTPVALVQFSKSKTVRAVPMTAKQDSLYVMGEALGSTAAESDIEWAAALRAIKSPEDRTCLRRGFVVAYASAMGKSEKDAGNRFDYLARKFAAPETSRQRKHAAKRKAGGGRKEKTGGTGEALAPQVTAQRLAAILHYIAAAQQKHAGDDELLEVLGEIAAIAGGAKK